MRRGDSVSLGKLSHVDVFDSWQFRNGECYLDASALLFDYQGNFVASVDYMRNHYSGVTHSGDQMTHQKGTHEVNLDLSRLPKRVQSVYIVLSAWADATFDDFMLPNVFCQDACGAELCRYELQAQGAKVQGKKNVIMCRIWRPTKSSAWKCDAIGSIGSTGDATNYTPIVASITAALSMASEVDAVAPEAKMEAGSAAACA